jgi:hypothetical protein
MKILMLGLALIQTPVLIAAGVTQSSGVSYAIQWQASAPNAGGQQAYGFRRSTQKSEWGLFINDYILAGGRPLVGGVYDFRYPLCGSGCLLQVYGQAGLGLSSAGVFSEIGWSTTTLWIFRIDVLTHLYFTRSRIINWSYPLWIGFTIPLP